MAIAVWIGFDLGVRGDYEGLYAWLDAHQARECGESLAFIRYDNAGSLRDALARDIRKNVKISKETRIYIVWNDDGKTKGRFIIGGRKAAPWSGYAMLESAEVDEA